MWMQLFPEFPCIHHIKCLSPSVGPLSPSVGPSQALPGNVKKTVAAALTNILSYYTTLTILRKHFS
jgi:hypothetical protein